MWLIWKNILIFSSPKRKILSTIIKMPEFPGVELIPKIPGKWGVLFGPNLGCLRHFWTLFAKYLPMH